MADWFDQAWDMDLDTDYEAWVAEAQKTMVNAWQRVAHHPIFTECYGAEGTLTDAMIERLDALYEKENADG